MTNDTPPWRTEKKVPSVDDAIAAIKAYVRFRDWSIYSLARAANMHTTALRHLPRPNWSPKSDTLRILYSLIPPDFDPRDAPPEEGYRYSRLRRKTTDYNQENDDNAA